MNDDPARIRSTTTLDDGAEVATEIIEPPEPDHRLGEFVICHGTPWSARMWRPLAAELGKRYRVHLWDMPGYGESIAEAVPGRTISPPVDFVAQRRRLAELLDIWELEQPHVLGHDIGGAVALGAHLLEGRDFASLYLLDVVTLDPWGSPFFRLVAENESVFTALPANLHRALVREYIAGAASPALDDPRLTDSPHLHRSRLDNILHLDDLVAPWYSAAGQSAFYRQVASLSPRHTQPIADRLGEVRCPVRIGWGEDDPWIPVEQAERLSERLPGRPSIIRFPGAGHLVPLEAPQELAADVGSWLQSRTTEEKAVNLQSQCT